MNVSVQKIVIDRSGTGFEGNGIGLVGKTGTVSPPPGYRLYRVRPDTETDRWGGQVRTLSMSVTLTPQVNPMTTEIGNPEHTHYCIMPQSWRKYWYDINRLYNDEAMTKKIVEMFFRGNTALFNYRKSPEDCFDHGMESLLFGSDGYGDHRIARNVIAGRSLGNGYVQVYTLKPTAVPPGPNVIHTAPYLFQTFVNVGHRRTAGNSPIWTLAVQGVAIAPIVSDVDLFYPEKWLQLVNS